MIDNLPFELHDVIVAFRQIPFEKFDFAAWFTLFDEEKGHDTAWWNQPIVLKIASKVHKEFPCTYTTHCGSISQMPQVMVLIRQEEAQIKIKRILHLWAEEMHSVWSWLNYLARCHFR